MGQWEGCAAKIWHVRLIPFLRHSLSFLGACCDCNRNRNVQEPNDVGKRLTLTEVLIMSSDEHGPVVELNQVFENLDHYRWLDC